MLLPKSPILPLLPVAFLALTVFSAGAAGTATMREEKIVLPTYKVAPPDPNPRFYSGRTYQGAKATFYPYPVSDQMTEAREDVEYKAVYLENRFIQISVLPELGGRIFTALDKGNGYDFFYRQHVVKPALIGMLGAWISGGVEWNIPHHHRASSFMPADYARRDNPDGSKTLWVGETELRHRLKWILGLTIRPDRSYIEMTVKVFNRTPAAQSFLFWINPAVHANADYQVIFPPSVEWAVQHGKPEFASWPLARQVYGGTDYTRGVDISWWKNHPSPVSFFAWDCREDFFGGYDHGRQAGVVQVSNHHVSPGKKFFEWGNGPEGEMWEKILSDEDGPYLELMAGSYSDNQPDYSWIQPGEVKVFTHFWYPVRDLGGVKNANIEGAVNLEVSNRTARVSFNTTADHKRARAVLRAGSRLLLDETVRIGPGQPFARIVNLPEDAGAETLRASLTSKGRELIAYQPAANPGAQMPKPVERPRPPREIVSAEELYFTGQRIEQLYSPSFEPEAYYHEALRRDPGDYRANTALGALLCRQGRYAEAEPLLAAATRRAGANYIRSKECEAEYYLGVALRAQGKPSQARDAFYRAIWSQAWQPAGYYALAELACAAGDYNEMLQLAERALETASLNSKALELKLAALRKLGRRSEARKLAERLLEVDPLNGRALHEQVLLATGAQAGYAKGKPDLSRQKRLIAALRGETSSWLELAIDYANAGLFEEAIHVMQTYLAQAAPAARVFPLAHYYLAWFNHRAGRESQADLELQTAERLPPDFCFPFQHEAEPILRFAIQKRPTDPRAPYYLGNLLYDQQPLAALELWQRAVGIDPQFALAQRNLGLARAQAAKDVPGAIACLEKAVALSPTDPRLYFELDVLYESGGVALEKRAALLDTHEEVVARRDDAVTRRVALLIASDRPEIALRILRERHFHNWEGSSSLHDVYVDACLQTGMKRLRSGNAADALRHFQQALEYPANQEVGKPRHEQRVAAIYYCVARAQEALGQAQDARAAYERAANARENPASEGGFFKAAALTGLGKQDDAASIFKALQRQGSEEIGRESEAVDYFAKFGEKRPERVRRAQGHYLVALGSLGLGDADAARRQLARALELHPAHLGARTILSFLKLP